jgi:hypothetical protein
VSPQIAVNTAVTRDELLDFIGPRHHGSNGRHLDRRYQPI